MLDVKLLVDNKPSITGRFRYGMQVSYMRPTLCFKDELVSHSGIGLRCPRLLPKRGQRSELADCTYEHDWSWDRVRGICRSHGFGCGWILSNRTQKPVGEKQWEGLSQARILLLLGDRWLGLFPELVYEECDGYHDRQEELQIVHHVGCHAENDPATCHDRQVKP